MSGGESRKPSSAGAGGRDFRLAAAGVLLFALLTAAGYAFPGSCTWGFDGFGFLPAPAILLNFGLTVLAILICRSGLLNASLSVTSGRSKFSKQLPVILFSAFVLILAWLLRVRVPLLGDSFFIVKNISEYLHNSGPLLLRNEPLATLWYAGVERLVSPENYEGFLTAFLAAGMILLAVHALVVYGIVTLLFGESPVKLPAFVLLLFLPVLQLFSGYVEVYGEVAVVLEFYLLLMLLVNRGRLSFAVLPAASVVVIASHYIGALLLPSLAYLGWQEYRRGNRWSVIGGVLLGCAVAMTGLSLIDFDLGRITASVPHSHFLPLSVPTDPAEINSSPYTLLSWFHAVDLLNQAVLLLGPVLVLAVIPFRRRPATERCAGEELLFGLIAVPVVIFALTVKYDLGPAKDWDVLAAWSVPAALAIIIRYYRRSGRGNHAVLALAALVMMINTIGYCLLNSTTEPALKRYVSFFDARKLSRGAFYTSTLHLAYYYHQIRDDHGPVAAWSRYSETYPSDPQGIDNLITNLGYDQPPDVRRIDSLYLRLENLKPGDYDEAKRHAEFCAGAGRLELARGDTLAAAPWYRKAEAEQTRAGSLKKTGVH